MVNKLREELLKEFKENSLRVTLRFVDYITYQLT